MKREEGEQEEGREKGAGRNFSRVWKTFRALRKGKGRRGEDRREGRRREGG